MAFSGGGLAGAIAGGVVRFCSGGWAGAVAVAVCVFCRVASLAVSLWGPSMALVRVG